MNSRRRSLKPRRLLLTCPGIPFAAVARRPRDPPPASIGVEAFENVCAGRRGSPVPVFDQKRRHIDTAASAVGMRGLVRAARFLADDVATAGGARRGASVADGPERGDKL